MASVLVPGLTPAPAPARRDEQQPRNTVIENVQQVSVRRAPPPGSLKGRLDIISPMSDHFPTPRAIPHSLDLQVAHGSPDSNSSTGSNSADESSLWSKRSSDSDFDELYDLSENESDSFPLKLSMSVKKLVREGETKSRYPSLVIPSPSQWPTIDKLRSATALSPPIQIALSPAVLSKLKDREQRFPAPASAPSLDGSLTSEELAASSCPPTPDIEEASQDEQQWEVPMQLDPSSISLLQQLNIEPQPDEEQPPATQIPQEAMVEMKKIVESSTAAGYFKLTTQHLAPADPVDAEDELSALSIPSPGGFFASLDSTVARATWSDEDKVPNTGIATEFYGLPFKRKQTPELKTSTATSFYDVPWAQRPDNPVEHVVTVRSPAGDEPITARKGLFSPSETIAEVDEIDETYDEALQQQAGTNINRTQLWLHAQGAYMRALCEEPSDLDDFAHIADVIPKTPEQSSTPDGSFGNEDSPDKKSVRFAVADAESPTVASATEEAIKRRISPIHDGTFWQAWRHAKRSQRARDVFNHRQARAEADQVKRVSLQRQHSDQLQGKFGIVDTEAERPDPHRPISSLIPSAPEDEKKELIAQAGRERQALEQIQSSSWHVAAKKEVNGGQLLTSPVVKSFKIHRDVMILDLAGQTQCSWAWSVAAEHPDASVYSTVASDVEAHIAESSLEGPANHYVVTAPRLWELPFGSNVFDVVSARNLYTHLKTTWPQGAAADEWDLTLRECLRVLKPGGYLEFELLDAELVHPEGAIQALGVEFSFNLKTRGYDPCSGKSFLPRVKRAGFCEIKRAWMVLPVADVNPKWSDSGKAASPTGKTIATSNDGLAITISKGTPQVSGQPTYQPPLTGSTRDVRAMTGLVGARMWEQWIVKLNSEMARSDTKCMDQIAKALEDGGKGGAGWRCLVGWARKDV